MALIFEVQMDRRLWEALLSHPMSAWREPGPLQQPEMGRAGRLLWCGIGGSLLPADALVHTLANPHALSRFLPLASPAPMELQLDPSDQLVFASKSGRTLELWTWIGRLRAMPGWGKWRNAPLVVSQNDENPLARWARSEGWPILPIPERVGGRYSAFTAIGTLPLQWLGLDAQAFLSGAELASSQARTGEGIWGERIWQMVATFSEGFRRGVDQWVLLPYADPLELVGAWWVQLVAESLGKVGRDGSSRRGLTPIRAIGPQDQHAQLQRWLEGPRNVGVVMVTLGDGAAKERTDPPAECPFKGLGSWSGAEILRAQAEGTQEALEAAGVPVVHWHLDHLDEGTLGAFLMSWQLVVGLTGMALELDPFDQPAVEAGKRRTLQKLGMA